MIIETKYDKGDIVYYLNNNKSKFRKSEITDVQYTSDMILYEIKGESELYLEFNLFPSLDKFKESIINEVNKIFNEFGSICDKKFNKRHNIGKMKNKLNRLSETYN